MSEKQNYQLISGVWEITMNCNLRCKHCGSGCEGPLPDELTTEEASAVCDSLGRLNMRQITLSGGEPFTRKDWPKIVRRLTDNGIKTNILSNGWLVDRETFRIAKDAGLTNLGISLDGLEEIHDFIRKKGSYAGILNTFQLAKEENMRIAVATCIHHKNLGELEGMKKVLIEHGVSHWQFQAAVPMGNMADHKEWLLDPSDIDRVIDFAYDTVQEGAIRVDLADNIGYYNMKEIEVRKSNSKSEFASGMWVGCQAGKAVIGIRCNGDVIGCLSIRDDNLIEANLRDIPIDELWNQPDAFSWNRELSKNKLTGFCKICHFGEYCRGGCSGMKQLRYNSLGENHLCSYRHAVECEKESIGKINDVSQLETKGREAIAEEEYQLADLYIARALQLDPLNVKLVNLHGFVHFFLENYPECESLNRKALELEPDNAYSLKGLGVCLSKSGRVDEGVEFLKQSIARSDENFMDPFFDLAVILNDNGRYREALDILEDGRNRSQRFTTDSESFYFQVQDALNN